MAINAGKKFENDFKNSVNTDEIFLHRFKDGTTGTVNGQMIRFKNKKIFRSRAAAAETLRGNRRVTGSSQKLA